MTLTQKEIDSLLADPDSVEVYRPESTPSQVSLEIPESEDSPLDGPTYSYADNSFDYFYSHED